MLSKNFDNSCLFLTVYKMQCEWTKEIIMKEVQASFIIKNTATECQQKCDVTSSILSSPALNTRFLCIWCQICTEPEQIKHWWNVWTEEKIACHSTRMCYWIVWIVKANWSSREGFPAFVSMVSTISVQSCFNCRWLLCFSHSLLGETDLLRSAASSLYHRTFGFSLVIKNPSLCKNAKAQM